MNSTLVSWRVLGVTGAIRRSSVSHYLYRISKSDDFIHHSIHSAPTTGFSSPKMMVGCLDGVSNLIQYQLPEFNTSGIILQIGWKHINSKENSRFRSVVLHCYHLCTTSSGWIAAPVTGRKNY
ncbi:hypothetical protein AVEN_178723-1 [Araneus ventricosus]|uniref:Uncharacterized protein n=1 Tax=Araneus ventricosus TaxID=182803 RepID=A0A4Y2Q0G9_ARAVE|nr:hypothetical protein AVEN_178723-1 [Araneus ventricosus]